MIMQNTNMGKRPMQKISVHIFLAVFTVGIGNLIYGVAVKRKQTQWDRTISALNNSTNHNHNYNH